MTPIKFDRHRRSARITDDPFWPKRVTGGMLATADLIKVAGGVVLALAEKIIRG